MNKEREKFVSMKAVNNALSRSRLVHNGIIQRIISLSSTVVEYVRSRRGSALSVSRENGFNRGQNGNLEIKIMSTLRIEPEAFCIIFDIDVGTHKGG